MNLETTVQANRKKLSGYQRQQASLEGEIKQIDSQIVALGIDPTEENIEEYLTEQGNILKQMTSTMGALLDEIDEIITEVEGSDD